MKKVFICSSLLILTSCGDATDYQVSDYLSKTQEQLILEQAVRYMYYTEGIPAASRFDSAYDAKYKRALRDFFFARYHFTDPSETHTFLMVRKYPGQKFRATGGMLKIDDSYRIILFEEVFVTPLSEESDVLMKGEFLFRQLAEKGSIEPKYFEMKSYVEWPDEYTTYDTISHQWVRGG